MVSMTNMSFGFPFEVHNMVYLIIPFCDSAVALLMKSWLLHFALNSLTERIQRGIPFSSFLYDIIGVFFLFISIVST